MIDSIRLLRLAAVACRVRRHAAMPRTCRPTARLLPDRLPGFNQDGILVYQRSRRHGGRYAMTLDGSGPHHAFYQNERWQPSAPSTPDSITSGGIGISSRGDRLGYYTLEDKFQHGFVYRGV